MFEVRIMCEDSKLHKVLWALDGLIVGMPQMLPVRNAVASKDKTQVREKVPGGANVIMRLYDRLSGEFTWKDAADIMEEIGAKSRSATSAYLSRLAADGKIVRIGVGMYKVVE